MRGRDVLPDHLGAMVFAVMREHERALLDGALIIVDETRARVRILPL